MAFLGLLILQKLEISTKVEPYHKASLELLFLWTTILQMRVSSHFVNFHLVNVDTVGIDLTLWEVDEVGRFISYTSNHCYRSVNFLVHQ